MPVNIQDLCELVSRLTVNHEHSAWIQPSYDGGGSPDAAYSTLSADASLKDS